MEGFMGTREKRSSIYPGPLINMLTWIIALSLVVIAAGCSKEEKTVVKQPKQVIRKKMPPPKKPTAPKRTAVKPVPSVSKKTPGIQKAHTTKTPQKVATPEKKPGHYRVKKGDTLFKIAGQSGIYNNSLMWPSLLRLNLNRLKGIKLVKGCQHQVLPAGMDLKFVTPSEAKIAQANLGSELYGVNVYSSQKQEKIDSLVFPLIKEGLPTYITKAKIKGKEWIRLRVGFFKTRAEAEAAAARIKSIVTAKDAWVARLGPQECRQYAGY